MSEKTTYKYKGQIFSRLQIYKILGISETKAYQLIRKHKAGLVNLPIFIDFKKNLDGYIEVVDGIRPPKLMYDKNEEYIETYRGFNIIKKRGVNYYFIAEHRALLLATVPVARRCIDTYFNHLEIQENELSR